MSGFAFGGAPSFHASFGRGGLPALGGGFLGGLGQDDGPAGGAAPGAGTPTPAPGPKGLGGFSVFF